MNYYERLFEYISNQIYNIFTILFGGINTIPNYTISFNIQQGNWGKKFNFQYNKYQGYEEGILLNNYCDYDTYGKFLLMKENFISDNELVMDFALGDFLLVVFFNTEKRPYINLFLDHIVKSYFAAKESALQKYIYNDLDLSAQCAAKCSFVYLNCELEEELIISRGVVEFFFNAYNIDVNMFTILSNKTYEGADIDCEIIIPRAYSGRGKRNLELCIKLCTPIYFGADEIRRIRKIMEIAKPPLRAMLNHKKFIVGFTKSDARSTESIISFLGKMNWKMSLRYADLIFCDGVYRISCLNVSDIYDFRKQILEMTERQNKKINRIVEMIKGQTHGTTLIFSNKECIKREAKRLAEYERGMLILPIDLDKNNDVILNLSSIDGAMMLDYDCNCYAIGVILDGDAVVHGRTERGARYNSAINYIKRQKRDENIFFALVVSEDKTIDYIFNNEF